MNTQEQIQHVEVSLEVAQEMVDFGDALLRLESNRDFQKVILQGYFRDEASRLVLLTGEPQLNATQKQTVYEDIRGIASLRQYFLTRRTMAEMARKEVNDCRETLDELREDDAAAVEE